MQTLACVTWSAEVVCAGFVWILGASRCMCMRLLFVGAFLLKKSVSKVAFSCRGVCRYFQTDQVRPCTYQRYYQFMHGYVLPRVVVLVDSIARAVRGMWCAGSIQ